VNSLTLPGGHVWLRLGRPDYDDPFDMSYAKTNGGRWNPPGSWPTLYLNEDMATVHAQVRHMFVGTGIEPDDLGNDAPIILAGAMLPGRQRVADVVSDSGAKALGLARSYPLDANGAIVGRAITQPIGASVHAAGLRGVWCRSASQHGNELAWFPSTRAIVQPFWKRPKPYGAWRHAQALDDVH
jgi:hypothetical protein